MALYRPGFRQAIPNGSPDTKLLGQAGHVGRTDQGDETWESLAKLQITKEGIDFVRRGPQRENENTGWKTRIGDPEIGAPPFIDTDFRTGRPNAILVLFKLVFQRTNSGSEYFLFALGGRVVEIPTVFFLVGYMGFLFVYLSVQVALNSGVFQTVLIPPFAIVENRETDKLEAVVR